MKYLCLGFRGFEEIIKYDVEEFFSASDVDLLDSGIVKFISEKIDDISRLQCIKLGIEDYAEFNREELKESLNPINEEVLSEFLLRISEKKTFKIKIIRNEIITKDEAKAIQAKLASVILENTGLKVDLKEPEIIIFVTASKERLFIGKNIAENKEDDLSKREYKLYNSGKSFDPAFAYSSFKSIFMDNKHDNLQIIIPFCGVGILPIEIALYLEEKNIEHKIYAYDLRSFLVRSAENNAKLAYVVDDLEFEKEPIDNLSNIHNNGLKPKANMLFAHLTSPTKRTGADILVKLYKKFLDQVLEITDNDADICLIIEKPDTILNLLEGNEKYSVFKVISNKIAYQGQLKHYIIHIKLEE